MLAVLLRINSTSTSGSQGQWPDSSFSSSHCFSCYSTPSLVPKHTCCFSKTDGDPVYSNPNPPPPPPRKKVFRTHTWSGLSIYPKPNVIGGTEHKRYKEHSRSISFTLLRLTTTKPMSSQNLGKDSNEYFSECFSLVKIVLMIEFCWKRFLKVLHFHKYHGFTFDFVLKQFPTC